MLIAANWKMSISCVEAVHLAQEIGKIPLAASAKVLLCPSFVHIKPVADVISGYEHIFLGAQDCSAYSDGAYTGEVSAAMLAELGCKYVIIGHSERRRYHNESADIINKKIMQAQQHNLIPIICVGESQASPLAEAQEEVMRQIDAISTTTNCCFAYEPSWAIGSNKAPSAQWIEDMIMKIKQKIGHQTNILYGGSVTADNINNLLMPKGSRELGSSQMASARHAYEIHNAARILKSNDEAELDCKSVLKQFSRGEGYNCQADGFLLGGASRSAESMRKILESL